MGFRWFNFVCSNDWTAFNLHAWACKWELGKGQSNGLNGLQIQRGCSERQRPESKRAATCSRRFLRNAGGASEHTCGAAKADTPAAGRRGRGCSSPAKAWCCCCCCSRPGCCFHPWSDGVCTGRPSTLRWSRLTHNRHMQASFESATLQEQTSLDCWLRVFAEKLAACTALACSLLLPGDR